MSTFDGDPNRTTPECRRIRLRRRRRTGRLVRQSLYVEHVDEAGYRRRRASRRRNLWTVNPSWSRSARIFHCRARRLPSRLRARVANEPAQVIARPRSVASMASRSQWPTRCTATSRSSRMRTSPPHRARISRARPKDLPRLPTRIVSTPARPSTPMLDIVDAGIAPVLDREEVFATEPAIGAEPEIHAAPVTARPSNSRRRVRR